MNIEEFSSFFFRCTELRSPKFLESIARRIFYRFWKLFLKVVIFSLKSPKLLSKPIQRNLAGFLNRRDGFVQVKIRSTLGAVLWIFIVWIMCSFCGTWRICPDQTLELNEHRDRSVQVKYLICPGQNSCHIRGQFVSIFVLAFGVIRETIDFIKDFLYKITGFSANWTDLTHISRLFKNPAK